MNIVDKILEGAEVRDCLMEVDNNPDHIKLAAKALDDLSASMMDISDKIKNIENASARALDSLSDAEFNQWSSYFSKAWKESGFTEKTQNIADRFETFANKLSEMSGNMQNFYKQS